MKMEQTECSETSAYKFQTLGYYPKESIKQLNLTSKFISVAMSVTMNKRNAPYTVCS